MAMTPKMEAIARFARMQLKHPMSKVVLHALLESPDRVERLTFVDTRDFLADTLVIAERGSDGPGFELELGATQREEVTIVNGNLVRHVRRTSSVNIQDPVEALAALRDFKGRLYVMFCFAGPPPVWYEAVVEPNPAVVSQTLSKESITELFDDIVRHQVDLLVLAVTLRQDIDDALARRDRAAFEKLAPVYREVVNRCVLWDF
ncbi:MAG: IDEAL domain-containing protein [Limnochordales bacterium]|nr:MAG: hypothetical protein DIU83_07620 [Bacillota bacterium]